MSMNSNEAVNEDVAGHGQTMQHNEPVAEDDEVEGHALTGNANEAVADDDVAGHGVTANANEAVAEDGHSLEDLDIAADTADAVRGGAGRNGDGG